MHEAAGDGTVLVERPVASVFRMLRKPLHLIAYRLVEQVNLFRGQPVILHLVPKFDHLLQTSSPATPSLAR